MKIPEQACADLVLANRILAAQGVVDAFGHVSQRAPDDPETFLISRSCAPQLIEADDIMRLDFDGNPVGDTSMTPYLERFIHGQIYAARPDVGAIVHSHSASVIPFGVVADVPLRPIYHMAGFLTDAVPIFEISDCAGPCCDMLVRDNDLGRALARDLGNSMIILMRGHGSTVVGTDLKSAVFHAVYAEVNAKIQLQAQSLGTPRLLSPGEARAAAKTNSAQMGRAWQLWALQAGFQQASETNPGIPTPSS
ncbi:class II aldolase/adducin family protein [Phyllobacterium salinisoli]|nr:class II aldolase/adducin family protein [Phyllobacterium salinisoli]